MKRKIFLSIFALFILSVSLAHEFWLQPLKFLLKSGEKLDIRIFVGEGFKGEPWSGTKDKIVKLTHYGTGIEESVIDNVLDSDPKRIPLAFNQAGNHLIAFNNQNKPIKLEAEKFNAYLKEEGLDAALNFRKEHDELNKEGRELYQRCVKTLVQVGDKQDDTFGKNTGMKLELIPKQNPYALRSNQALTFFVLFENQPLPNALVLLWHHTNGHTTVKKVRSNATGEVTFPLQKNGRWMISTVQMVPHLNPQEADWQSYWGSYTFGFY